jgi:hypothetical protein
MMLSRLLGFAAHAAFLHTPYPPTPFHPRQGGKGSSTAIFDFVAPGALLRSQGCHCPCAPRRIAYGRSGFVVVCRANGGRVATRARCKQHRVVACAPGERAAPRSLRTKTSAFTTTGGSPMRAPKHAAQPHARNSLFGAQPPNRYSAPLSALARVERGWGIGGELNRSAGKNPGVNT